MSDDAHTGQLPRALTGVRCRAHSPQSTGQLPRALTRALTAGEGSAGLEEGACLPLPFGQGNGSRRGVVKRVVLMLTNDSARKAT